MEAVVDELCSNTVPSNPIIKPAIGLLRIALEVNTSPVEKENSWMIFF